MRSNTYYMLICSLSALPPRFDVDRLPITLERLQARLRVLEPEDAQEISRMLDILAWSRQGAEATDTAVVQRYGALMQEVTNPLVREVFAADMDVRMIVAALRRRRHGLGPPTVGVGPVVRHTSVATSTSRISGWAMFFPGSCRSRTCSSKGMCSTSTGECWGKPGPT